MSSEMVVGTRTGNPQQSTVCGSVSPTRTLERKCESERAECEPELTQRPARVPFDIEDMGPDAVDEFTERAGIMEFCGGMARDKAEARAAVIIRRMHTGGRLVSGGGA